MIYPVTMYAGKCDNCGKEMKLGGGEYSAYGDPESVEFEMEESAYHIDSDKHYCPDCWSYDDEDNIVLKTLNK